MHNFSLFFQKKVNEQCVNFSHVWRKNIIVWETFEQILKIFLRKYQKCFILAYFEQQFKIPALIFRPFGRKKQIVGKFWENFHRIS